jgi:hypothetical protein
MWSLARPFQPYLETDQPHFDVFDLLDRLHRQWSSIEPPFCMVETVLFLSIPQVKPMSAVAGVEQFWRFSTIKCILSAMVRVIDRPGARNKTCYGS